MPISNSDLASFKRSQFRSLIVVPPLNPRICVCTAPLTPVVQISLFIIVIPGEIADAGGDLTVVSFTLLLLVVTVLVLRESVIIGSV